MYRQQWEWLSADFVREHFRIGSSDDDFLQGDDVQHPAKFLPEFFIVCAPGVSAALEKADALQVFAADRGNERMKPLLFRILLDELNRPAADATSVEVGMQVDADGARVVIGFPRAETAQDNISANMSVLGDRKPLVPLPLIADDLLEFVHRRNMGMERGRRVVHIKSVDIQAGAKMLLPDGFNMQIGIRPVHLPAFHTISS